MPMETEQSNLRDLGVFDSKCSCCQHLKELQSLRYNWHFFPERLGLLDLHPRSQKEGKMLQKVAVLKRFFIFLTTADSVTSQFVA